MEFRVIVPGTTGGKTGMRKGTRDDGDAEKFRECAGVTWNGKINQKPRPETQQTGLGTTKLESATWA